MFHQSVQHAIRKSTFVKRLAVTVGAGLVATIATAMVGWMSAPRMEVSPASGTRSSPPAPAIGVLRRTSRLRCAGLGPDSNRFDRQGPSAATGDSTFALRTPAGCSLPTLFAQLEMEPALAMGHRHVALHPSLAAVTSVFIRAQLDARSHSGGEGSGADLADPRSGSDTATAAAQRASRRSSEELSDAV